MVMPIVVYMLCCIGCGSEHCAFEGAWTGRTGAGENPHQHPGSGWHHSLALQVSLRQRMALSTKVLIKYFCR